MSAIDEALDEAGRTAEEIDLIVWTGVDRGFVEPACAYMIADALGLKTAQCFDVVDACNSWSRAIHTVYLMLKSGCIKTALVVNAEFNMVENRAVYPALFSLKRLEEMEWSFPGYTLGEAATATVLSHDPEREWEFHFSSRPDLSDLCTVPLPGYEHYCKLGLEPKHRVIHETPAMADSSIRREPETLQSMGSRIGRNGWGRFTSFGGTMFQEGFAEEVAILKKLSVAPENIDIIFPHAASRRLWDDMGREAGIDEGTIHHMYPEFGNLVSASVPAGIAVAKQRKKFKEGDTLVGWVGSAGMSFSTYSFVW
jgi:3-oxoacyl-[acyl-carrier-protein] synthase III